MNLEARNDEISTLLIFDEGGKLGNRKYFIPGSERIDPFSDISVESAVILGKKYPNARLIFDGSDPFSTGINVADVMEKKALLQDPSLKGRTKVIRARDTSYQSEEAFIEMQKSEYGDGSVGVVAPFEHIYRATTHLKAFGVENITVFESNSTYIKERGISRDEKKRRVGVVRKAYFERLNKLASYFNVMKELGMGPITALNKDGSWIRRISDRGRSVGANA